jgi:hypothetical protein
MVIAITIYTYQRLSPSGTKITVENCLKIEMGMTIQEVESVFGVEAGDYSGAGQQSWIGIVKSTMGTWKGNPPSHIWLGEEVSFGIWLDEAGLVANMGLHEHAFQGKRFFERVKLWLGL